MKKLFTTIGCFAFIGVSAFAQESYTANTDYSKPSGELYRHTQYNNTNIDQVTKDEIVSRCEPIYPTCIPRYIPKHEPTPDCYDCEPRHEPGKRRCGHEINDREYIFNAID